MEVLNKDSIIDALKDVYDPEIPVNVVDLGLIYNVEVEDNEVHVEMTLNSNIINEIKSQIPIQKNNVVSF